VRVCLSTLQQLDWLFALLLGVRVGSCLLASRDGTVSTVLTFPVGKSEVESLSLLLLPLGLNPLLLVLVFFNAQIIELFEKVGFV